MGRIPERNPLAAGSAAAGAAMLTILSSEVTVEGNTIVVRAVLKSEERYPIHGRGEGEITGRQSQVLELIRKGKSNKEIGAELRISERCVKFHVSTLLRLLCARSRFELMLTRK